METIKDSKGREHRIITKKIKNVPLQAYAAVLDAVRSDMENLLSDKSKQLFYDLCMSVHNDIGHLRCDTICEEYIIEKGYNFDE